MNLDDSHFKPPVLFIIPISLLGVFIPMVTWAMFAFCITYSFLTLWALPQHKAEMVFWLRTVILTVWMSAMTGIGLTISIAVGAVTL